MKYRKSIAVTVLLASSCWAGLPVSAKKGRDDAKTEVGSSLDDRTRHGRGNGDSGTGSSTSGGGSGRSGEKAGYDREGNRNGSGNGGNGSNGGGAVAASASVPDIVRFRRDELDRF